MRILSAGITFTAACLLIHMPSMHGQTRSGSAPKVYTAPAAQAVAPVVSQGKSRKMAVRYFGFGPLDNKRRDELNEDVSVLNHLVMRSLPTIGTKKTMGVTVRYVYGKNEALFVEGKGLILNYHVGFPVAQDSDSKGNRRGNDKKESVDEWEQARTELKANRGSVLIVGSRGKKIRKAYYNKERVDELDQMMKKLLRHVSKIRNMKSTDSVTVYVRGPGSKPGHSSVMAWRINLSDVTRGSSVDSSRIKTTQYHESGSSSQSVNSGFYYEVESPRVVK